MEVDVTEYLDGTLAPMDYSASIAEIGHDAGEYTWRAAMEQAGEHPLITGEQQDELRDYIRSLGAWDEAEVAAMTDVETNALLIQCVAGDAREVLRDPEAYSTDNGRIYTGDHGRWYFYVGE